MPCSIQTTGVILPLGSILDLPSVCHPGYFGSPFGVPAWEVTACTPAPPQPKKKARAKPKAKKDGEAANKHTASLQPNMRVGVNTTTFGVMMRL